MTKPLPACATREEVLAWVLGTEETEAYGGRLTIFRCAHQPCIEQALTRMEAIGRLAGLREAANIAEQAAVKEAPPQDEAERGWENGCSYVALRIRALADKGAE